MIWKLAAKIALAIIHIRYRITINGMDEIKAKADHGILFLANHPGLIDPVILTLILKKYFNPRILADSDRINIPVISSFLKNMRVIPMPDPAVYGKAVKEEVIHALLGCAAALDSQDNVLVYPAGRIYRSKMEAIGGNSSVETILKNCRHPRIVLISTKGIWGSSFSRASGSPPLLGKSMMSGVISAIKSFIIFTPKRNVSITLYEPENFPLDANKTEINAYLESFYNREAESNTYVPYTIWEKGGTRILPEVITSRHHYGSYVIPESVKTSVISKLSEVSGISAENISDKSSLSSDLGIDSLSKIEIISWIEFETGYPVTDPESIITVSDIFESSVGKFSGTELIQSIKVNPKWFKKKRTGKVIVPDGRFIQELFVKQVRNSGNSPLASDQMRGTISYREAAVGIYILKKKFMKFKETHIGLMFPASASFPVIYLSILFSGKIPVLVNWTTGTRSVLEMMDMLNVHMIVTSRAFTEKLTSLGTDLSAISDRFIFAEDFAASVKLTEKISSALKLRFFPGLLHGKNYPDTAAVLFTSGSESTPKTVPLTHENILSNIRDAINSFTLYNHDSLIGILPPFHSFGLTVTILLPALCGLKTCYHPNPTEGRMIAKLINSYKTTVMIATPTFLDTIAQNAEPEDLDALRLVVAGAEKCPLRLYDFIENNWPKLRIIEGYGITECSPVVSVNREDNPIRGSIGKLLPSFEYSIINPDTGKQVEEGESGILLLRGPSVFGGYLNYSGKSPFITFNNLQWYNSGDIVKEEHGSLFFTGRLKRFIKLGGEMISLPLIEEILSDSFSGNEGEVVIAVDSNGDDENTEIILFHTIDLTRTEANSLLREKGLSPIYFIRKTIKVDEIPKLGSGKTDYRKLRLLVS